MTTRVFFCYDPEDLKDQRVETVRQCWLSRAGCEDSGIFEGEDLKGFTISGDAAVKQMIVANLEHTSVTCVVIGASTYSRRWVRYAIVESVQRGNRLVGVHVNGIPDRSRRTRPAGRNPLDHLALSFAADGGSVKVQQYMNGDWVPFPDNPGWPLSRPVSEQRRGRSLMLSSMFRSYDWAKDDGPANLHQWLAGEGARPARSAA
jgi:hypothetical protein